MEKIVFFLLFSSFLMSCSTPSGESNSEQNPGETSTLPLERTGEDESDDDVERKPALTGQFNSEYVSSEGTDCGDAVNPADAPEGSDIPGICELTDSYNIYKDWNFFGAPILTLMAAGDVEWETSLSPQCEENHVYGEKVELRTYEGQAFAIILRCTCMNYPDGDVTGTPVKGREVLMVRGLMDYEDISDEIDVSSTPNANQAARDYADRVFTMLNE